MTILEKSQEELINWYLLFATPIHHRSVMLMSYVIQSCGIKTIGYEAKSTPKLKFSSCRITFHDNVSCKKSNLVTACWVKCMSLNQILYTLPFVLLNRVSFSGFVFVFASVSKFLLWIGKLLFQQLETFLSSCLCGLLFSNFFIFRQNSMLAKELTLNELLVFLPAAY